MVWALTQWEAFAKIALLLNVEVIRPSGFTFPLCQISFLVRGLLRKSRILRRSLLPPSLLKGGWGGWGLGMPLVLLPLGLPLLPLDLVQREEWRYYETLVQCALGLLFPRLLRERGCQESLVAADACCLLCPVLGRLSPLITARPARWWVERVFGGLLPLEILPGFPCFGWRSMKGSYGLLTVRWFSWSISPLAFSLLPVRGQAVEDLVVVVSLDRYLPVNGHVVIDCGLLTAVDLVVLALARCPGVSGQLLGTGRSLHPWVVRPLLCIWGIPSVSLIAASRNMSALFIAPSFWIRRPSPGLLVGILGRLVSSRWGPPFRVEAVFFSALDRNEDTSDFVLPWFRVFTMGSPFSGRGRNFMIAPSIGMKSLAEPCYQVLRDEVTLWVVCGPRSTLDRERRISLVFGLSFFRMRSPF